MSAADSQSNQSKEESNSAYDYESGASPREYKGFDETAQDEVRSLARTLTNQEAASKTNSSKDLIRYLSHMSQVPGVQPFDETDERLNPNSDQFSAKFWVKNMRKLLESDPDYYKPSSLGIAYKNLRASGIASDSDYQPTVTNALYKLCTEGYMALKKDDPARYFDILKSMDGLIRPGELTVVLGRPGSGCSTLLKTIAAQTYGFKIGEESVITYDGLSQADIEKRFRGGVVYSAETDVHFPYLTVGDTLNFASRLKTPSNRGEIDRETYAEHMTSVYMATYGLLHTRNTNVGDDFVRGVSGGERKRVSIAEVSLCGSSLQCWDNATRGLDAATALEFIRALKTSAAILETTPLIAIYQCSQDAYDLFDKAVVLYEGYQIYFGRGDKAKEYFVEMGWECPPRQTTADFLTSLTNPVERKPRPGFENKVPHTPQEFEAYWKNSKEYQELVKEVDAYIEESQQKDSKQKYCEAHVAKQTKWLSPNSPYSVNFGMQVKYIMGRNILRTKGNPSITLQSIFGQFIMALILSSVFYNLQPTTGSFYYRGAAMFFAVLFNAFSSLLEIMALFEARPIVEKHKKYAMYRPSADALASIITELPTKLIMSLAFNITFYFMVHFRRNAGRFFFYMLMNFSCTLVMSHLFRSIGAMSTSLSAAMTPATTLLLAMVIFTGFVIPTPKMLGWSRWINYINPVGYVFESLMDNEFSGVEYKCSAFVPQGPGYDSVDSLSKICGTEGSKPGSSVVEGADYLAIAYQYYNSHKWRNWGITVGFIVFFLFIYIILTEYNKGAMQKGEIALYLQGTLRKQKKEISKNSSNAKDIENNASSDEKISYKEHVEGSRESQGDNKLPKNTQTFHWKDLTYQVQIKSEQRVILDHVDGWVKPGQLTALMGSSGAGKTTLLNCLSERLTTGVVTDGVRMVNGHSLDSSFQRSIGYVQQQDLHLATSTVREAFRFSAYLRQPNSVSKKEKDEYVEYIIDLLDMRAYSDALVGVAGEGLNVEQRKRLTIGVELVAKPQLLLFLDEPTSGLDSQTAWSICQLMRKLADHGQAILCTIHQPSALLLQEFDRLLFLQKGGKTVYFGELGKNCETLINYFEKYGAHHCPADANPAEWMLEVVGAAPGSKANQDYHEVWKNSTEYAEVRRNLDTMEQELVKLPRDTSPESHKTYAAPIWKQYLIVTARVLEQDWRSPGYIYSKLFLTVTSSLFNGFSFFKANNSRQGLQNQMFSMFMFYIPFNTLLQQMLPYYIKQREVYEVREAPSRTFSWFVFITAQITSEIPFQVVMGTLAYFCWYYPVGLYRNAEPTDQVDARGVLMWMFITSFYVYVSTMGQLCASFNEFDQNAANLATLLFTMCLNFCGVLAGPDFLPGFWIFMYRCNPFTYLVQGMMATGLANTSVQCSKTEILRFKPPSGQTCADYLKSYMSVAGGNLLDPSSTSECEFCQLRSTNDFLTSVNAIFSERWRNFGIFIVFIAFNIILTVFFYWLARVPKGSRKKKSA
ncbi:Piso0_002291 [Millerozyma farinosa CBS 7064]|uniref:Piso0_002291 protein n=1 Tax=Pichia sorbitophila (strain ATCC MYA-4447 / BCRC 22081 / CBS 7064 / NBRC 10061 / NRRL Y-12695) TaxID=559304 RepID=G8YEN0_PICSO|nr:Piso0_002291 [Millerozyma farinosa CBS 7064]